MRSVDRNEGWRGLRPCACVSGVSMRKRWFEDRGARKGSIVRASRSALPFVVVSSVRRDWQAARCGGEPAARLTWHRVLAGCPVERGIRVNNGAPQEDPRLTRRDGVA